MQTLQHQLLHLILNFLSCASSIATHFPKCTNPKYSCWISDIKSYFRIRRLAFSAPIRVSDIIQKRRMTRNNKKFSNGLSNVNHFSNFGPCFKRDSEAKCINSIFLTNIMLPFCFVDRKSYWQLFGIKSFSSCVSLKLHLQQLLLLLSGSQPAKVKLVTRIYSQRRERQHTILYQGKLQVDLHYKAHSFVDSYRNV